MDKHDFKGRVAVVTGAGRGLGRAYALLLAERGASVVANDLGGEADGTGADEGPATDVAAEIVAAGGVALADTNDVSTVEGGAAIVSAAVAKFGRIDILVNNAGIIRWGGPEECDVHNLESQLAVHVTGSFNTTRAAWPHMVRKGYGRIVMTTSTGMFGLSDNLSYATAKAAVVGMMRSLAIAGADRGIKTNAVAPVARGRMGKTHPASPLDGHVSPQAVNHITPEVVAPLVAFLAHEACPVSGEVYSAGAGHFARIFIAETKGYIHPKSDPTLEDVAENWNAITTESGYYVPTSSVDWISMFMEHLTTSAT